MPRTGRNIYKRKDGRWEGRYPKGRDINKKLVYGYLYGKTYTEVKQRLSSLCVEDLKISAPAIATTDCISTFAEVVNDWLNIISLQVKPSTFAGYMSTLELHIMPSLGSRQMHSLTAVDMSSFARSKMENGRVDGKGGLSAKTVRDMLSIIKSVTDFALEQNIISSSIKITYPKQPAQTMRVLSRQEQLSLETVLTTDTNVYKVGVLLCLYTGLRIGEICALRWQDISPEFDTLSVQTRSLK